MHRAAKGFLHEWTLRIRISCADFIPSLAQVSFKNLNKSNPWLHDLCPSMFLFLGILASEQPYLSLSGMALLNKCSTEALLWQACFYRGFPCIPLLLPTQTLSSWSISKPSLLLSVRFSTSAPIKLHFSLLNVLILDHLLCNGSAVLIDTETQILA